tara:strand:+ start:7951 stop:8637 length:687 start_codon:yes stop_codon:yes gene_type:complete
MKWCIISKDDVSVLSINRMKDKSKISNKEDVIKFIHKKNTKKGKVQSITLKGPYKDKNVNKWIICYLQPLNKNHLNSEWELNCPDGKFKVYNGALLIHTLEKDDNNEYPDILSTKDIDENSCLEWKVSKNDSVNNDSVNNDSVNNKNDEPEDEDVSDVDNINDDLTTYANNDEPDYDEIIDDDDVFEMPKATEINNAHSVELNNDLLTNTSNLEFEKYDYESPIIPVM